MSYRMYSISTFGRNSDPWYQWFNVLRGQRESGETKLQEAKIIISQEPSQHPPLVHVFHSPIMTWNTDSMHCRTHCKRMPASRLDQPSTPGKFGSASLQPKHFLGWDKNADSLWLFIRTSANLHPSISKADPETPPWWYRAPRMISSWSPARLAASVCKQHATCFLI